MNPEKFTIKTQEALQEAHSIAQQNGQQLIENGHLIKGLLNVDTTILPFMMKEEGIDTNAFENEIDSIIASYPKVSGGNIQFSSAASRTLSNAQQYATKMEDEFVALDHLLFALSESKDRVSDLLKKHNLTTKQLKKHSMDLRNGDKVTSQSQEDTYKSLEKYAVNLNEMAKNGKLDPVIGRDEEIRRVLQILTRRTKNNPILIGEPGTGKTAIAEGIAHRIISNDVPENLQSKQLFSLDMGALIAGAKFKGEFVKHEQEDELFYVIDGKLFIELIDQTLELNTGEFVVIPKGIEHKPYAPKEVSVMLFEPASTLNTGNTKNELTVSDLDKI